MSDFFTKAFWLGFLTRSYYKLMPPHYYFDEFPNDKDCDDVLSKTHWLSLYKKHGTVFERP